MRETVPADIVTLSTVAKNVTTSRWLILNCPTSAPLSACARGPSMAVGASGGRAPRVRVAQQGHTSAWS